MNTKYWLLAALLLAASAEAATPLDPSQVLEFPISRGGLTRISIENDGIDDIYVYPTKYADNIQHHKSGHVFVVADEVAGALNVTLITKRGVAQDIKLTPTRKKTEPILLKFENEESKQQETQEKAASLLEQFVQGVVPAGFYAIDTGEVSRGRGAIVATVERSYQNSDYRVLVLNVSNDGKDQVALDNRLVWEEGDLALAFDKSALEPNQQATLYIIQKR